MESGPHPGAMMNTLGPPPLPPQAQQLPPQMFTTAAQLLDLTDTNLVLQSTIERVFATVTDPQKLQTRGLYADKPHGIFLIRGENVLLLGEIDLDKDDDPPFGYEKAEFGLVEKLANEQKAAEKVKETKKLKKLATLGFEGENMGEILL
ncbi:hypothetical protein RRF57_006974 [Xylaria bambusicola]|uniref:LSM domain-containing protein n=1 Tax=Xylaria bambusicola TaxID=326684 RepID=A0AAN7UFE6_9PEZI